MLRDSIGRTASTTLQHTDLWPGSKSRNCFAWRSPTPTAPHSLYSRTDSEKGRRGSNASVKKHSPAPLLSCSSIASGPSHCRGHHGPPQGHHHHLPHHRLRHPLHCHPPLLLRHRTSHIGCHHHCQAPDQSSLANLPLPCAACGSCSAPPLPQDTLTAHLVVKHCSMSPPYITLSVPQSHCQICQASRASLDMQCQHITDNSR